MENVKHEKKAMENMTVKKLLEIAKDLNVIGRHDMKKEQLMDAILAAQPKEQAMPTAIIIESKMVVVEVPVDKQSKQQANVEHDLAQGGKEEWDWLPTVACDVAISKPKDNYIDSAKIGTIIAFKINDTKVISGMIEEVVSEGKEFKVRTKNGVKFMVKRKNIVWVKTGDRWPKGVYLALKGEAADENRAAN